MPSDKAESSTRVYVRSRSSAVRSAFLAGASAKIVTTVCMVGSIAITTRTLTPSEFGVVATMTGSIGLLGFLDFGIGNAVIRRLAVAHARSDGKTAVEIVSSAILTLGAIAVVIIAVASPIIAVLPERYLFQGADVSPTSVRLSLLLLIVGTALAIPFSLGSKVALAVQRGQTNSITLALGGVATLVAIAIGHHWHLPAPYFVGSFIAIPVLSNLVQTSWIVWFSDNGALRPQRRSATRSETKAMLRSGVPFMLLAVSGIVAYQADSLIIAYVLGSTAAGVFGLTLRMFNTILSLYTAGLMQLWGSIAHALASSDYAWVRNVTRRVIWMTLGSSAVLCLFLTAMGREIVTLWAGAELAPPVGLLVALAIWSTYNLGMSQVSFLLNAAGQVTPQAIASAAMAIACLPLSIWLAERIGISGTIWANLLTHAVFVGPLSLILVRRVLTDVRLRSSHGASMV